MYRLIKYRGGGWKMNSISTGYWIDDSGDTRSELIDTGYLANEGMIVILIRDLDDLGDLGIDIKDVVVER